MKPITTLLQFASFVSIPVFFLMSVMTRCLAGNEEQQLPVVNASAKINAGNNVQVTNCQLKSISLTEASMLKAVQLLRARGIPVCFEQAKIDSATGVRSNPDGPIKYLETTFSIERTNVLLGQLLDDLVALDRKYEWRLNSSANRIVVFPKEGSRLAWLVPALKIENITIHDVIKHRDLFGLASHKIALLERGVSLLEVNVRHLETAGMAARDALASVCQFRDGLYWTLGGLGEKGVLSFSGTGVEGN